MHELVWFLLPLAAFGGWYAARRGNDDLDGRNKLFPGPEYLRGLDYLLNEQPDKAIDIFVRMLEVGGDTVETHLALGNLFRKRGEVDRAIRIHRNLVARDSLSMEQRSNARLELGRDYQSAGLLDRAEEQYAGLLHERDHVEQVLPLLLDIYQQEKDWESAISTAGRMEQIDGRPVPVIMAHFFCEMAERAREQGDVDKARNLLDRALDMHEGCARASLLLGNIEREEGNCEAALTAYSRVGRQDLDLLPEVLGAMYACHCELGRIDRMIEYLRECIPHYNDIAPVCMLADILVDQHRQEEACECIERALVSHPTLRGLAKYAELRLAGSESGNREVLVMLKDLTDRLQKGKPAYLCHECGFAGKTLHWQCPGCRHWDSIRPIRGVDGDWTHGKSPAMTRESTK